MFSNTRSPWLIAIVTMLCVVRGCTLLITESVVCGCGPEHRYSKQTLAEHQVERLVSLAGDLDHPRGRCPGAADMQGVLASLDATDPWGHAWAYECDDGHVVVRSDGEDGVANTLDDVVGREPR
nr:hypothetical protein [Kofleriaceae bacterium]